MQSPKTSGYKVAVYIRLSVEDNKKRGNSIESQRCIIENHIALNPEFEIVDTYIDNGTTGTNFEREAFKRMLADAESGKVNCIITKDLSRLGRNTIDTGYYIEKHFPLNNTRFIAVNDNYDSDDKDSVHGGIILPLKNMINEAYSIDISRKIREQQHQAMKAGEYVGSRPPYGYLKSPDNCHKLIIDPETAPVVRQIYEWFLENTSVNHIVRLLNESEAMTPIRRLKQIGFVRNEVGKGLWQTQAVTKILTGDVYAGDMVQGKSRTVNHEQIAVPESEWVRVQSTHEPIVSREDFAKVQARLKLLADNHAAKPVKAYTPNVFRGKVFCGHCGGSMNRHKGWRTKNGDVYIFSCLSNERKARGSCESFSIREDKLTQTLLAIIKTHSAAVHGKALKLRNNSDSIDMKHQESQSEISALRREIDKNRRMFKSLYENHISGLITSEEYHDMRVSYEAAMENSAAHIADIENRQKELDRQTAEYCEISDLIADTENNSLTSTLIERLVDRILIFADKSVDISFRFASGFNLIGEQEATANG
jgi:DNA invertase Pin-like site-specific DNA recombinase